LICTTSKVSKQVKSTFTKKTQFLMTSTLYNSVILQITHLKCHIHQNPNLKIKTDLPKCQQSNLISTISCSHV
jgi:hypothetical protein